MFAIITILLGVAACCLIISIVCYNKLVRARQNVKESWSAIETELARRYDLIPNLVETVSEFASHEKQTLEDVVAARNLGMANLSSVKLQEKNADVVFHSLRQLLALDESYPQLRSNQNFVQLQKDLNETETRISHSRRFYNANVREFNNLCEMCPSFLIARLLAFHPLPYFGIDIPEAFESVRISFEAKPHAIQEELSVKSPSMVSQDQC